MTARLSEHDGGVANGRSVATHQNEPSEPQPEDRARVVSVSARQTDRKHATPTGEADRSTMATGTVTGASTVFLTPRVIDQEAFDELSRRLCDLIERASEHGMTLGASVAEAGRIEDQVTKSNASLQERLRISARMLKAFQSQIVRVESGIAEIEEQCKQTAASQAELDAAREQFQTQRDAAIAEAQEALDNAARHTLATFDNAITDRTKRLEAIEARLSAFEDRTASLERTIENTEQAIASAAERNERLCERLATQQTDSRTIIEQCEQAKHVLGEHLIEAGESVDRIEHRCRDVAETVRAENQRLALMNPRITQVTDDLNALADRLGEAEQLRSELAAMLEQLRAWQPLLHRSDEDQQGHFELPKPLVQVVETVQARVEANLVTFSQALRDMADEFEHLTSDSHEAPEQAATNRASPAAEEQ